MNELDTALPDDLLPSALSPRLRTRRFGRRYEPVARCDSTNDLLTERARRDAPEGLVVLADSQGAGRGRLGRTWFSPPGQNLYASLLARPGGNAAALFPVTLLAGAVVGETLAALGFPAEVKWPNDVLCGGKKVAGILTEMATLRGEVRHVVVGIGLNVNTRTFPDELGRRATSLLLQGGRELPRALVLAELLNRWEPAYDEALRDGATPVLERFRALARFPRPCRVNLGGANGETVVTGTAVDVESSGALVLVDGLGKTRRIVSGEVTLEAP